MFVALEKISKILVPVDGSESSVRAAEAAINLAKRYNAALAGSATDMMPGHPIEIIAL